MWQVWAVYVRLNVNWPEWWLGLEGWKRGKSHRNKHR